MKVFNPNPVPVVVDDGVVVEGLGHGDIAGGPVAVALVERGQLLDQTVAEPVDEPQPEKAPRASKETR